VRPGGGGNEACRASRFLLPDSPLCHKCFFFPVFMLRSTIPDSICPKFFGVSFPSRLPRVKK
jgi:hypothetical protein